MRSPPIAGTVPAMNTPGRTIFLLSALAIVATIGLPGPAGAGSGSGRYASPSGSGTTCSPSHPCSLLTAVNQAHSGAEVVVGPGTYGSATGPIAASLAPKAKVDVRGPAAGTLPIIHSSATTGVKLGSATLSNVEVISTGKAAVFATTGSINHVIARTSANGAAACATEKTLADSVCQATGVESVAVSIEPAAGGPGTNHVNVAIRGVTAEATDPSSVGLIASAEAFTAIKVTAKNDIIHGGMTDVEAQTNKPTASAQITLSHSDFVTTNDDNTGGSTTIVGDHATDVTAHPHFLGAISGNFREKAGSPTIDKGATDPLGSTDVVGRPRTVGSAPDMGAFEFLQRPAVSHVKKGTVTANSVSVTARLNTEGLKTRMRLRATHGHTRLQSPWVPGGHLKRTPIPVHLKLSGLARGQTYDVQVIANNAGGTTTSKKTSVKTR